MCPSARFFLCTRCRQQVLLCRRCDRGQLYCGAWCSHRSRRERQREANRRNSKTRNARIKNAQRQDRFRQRQIQRNAQADQKVTDQGSPTPESSTNVACRDSVKLPAKTNAQNAEKALCFSCGVQCSVLVRQHFLLPHQRRRQARPKEFIP